MNNLIVGERYTWFNKRTSNQPIAGWSIVETNFVGSTITSKYYREPGFSINTHVIVEFLGYNDLGSCNVKVVNKKGEEVENGSIYNGLVEECLKQV